MKLKLAIDSIITEQHLQSDFVDAIYYEPETKNEEEYARIFFHVEVRNNPSISRTIKRVIFDNLTQSIYKNLENDLGETFELTLKEVNNAIKKLSEDEGEEWLDNLHASIIIVSQDNLHMTVCGEGRVLMVREKQVMSITDGLCENLDKEHLFQNIASGKISQGDTFMAINKALPTPIFDALGSWSNHHELQALFSRLDSELKTYSISVLGFLILPKETLNEIPKEQSSNLLKFSGIINNFKSFFFPSEKVKNKSENIIHTNSHTDSDLKNESFENTNSRDVRSYKETSDLADLKSAINTDSSNITKNKFENTLKLAKRNLTELMKKLPSSKKTSYTNSFSPQGKNFNKKSMVMIGVIIVILGFVSLSIYNKYQQNQEIETLREKISFIDEKIADAKTRNALEDKEKAREIVELIYTSMEEIKQSTHLQKEIQQKEKEISSLEDRIDEITRIEPEEYSNLSKKFENVDAISIVKLGDTIFAISKKVVFKLLLSEVVLDPIKILQDGEFAEKAVSFEEDQSIIIYTNQNRIISYQEGEFKEESLINPNINWGAIRNFDTYGRRLYTINEEGKILRYSKTNNGFDDPTNYTPSIEVDINLMKDLTIDGDIYYLLNNGDIYRTRSQGVQDFTLTEFPQELDFSKVKSIQKSPVLRQLFIFDPENKRIVVTGFRGYYVKQFVFNDLEDVQDMFIDEGARKLYLLSKQKVFVINL